MDVKFKLNKLSQYKVAIDDGFRCSYFLDKSYFISIRKKRSRYTINCFIVGENMALGNCLFSVREEDFDKFEKTTKDTFNKYGIRTE